VEIDFGTSSTFDGRIAGVPTLNIKDPEVYRLAAELARRRGTSMTTAVREALTAALARREDEAQERSDRLMEISRRSAARPEPYLSVDDLYDDKGLPR
jgi:antitoxin VapB